MHNVIISKNVPEVIRRMFPVIKPLTKGDQWQQSSPKHFLHKSLLQESPESLQGHLWGQLYDMQMVLHDMSTQTPVSLGLGGKCDNTSNIIAST